jgi:NADPH:quinone reductase-like Zn-dependent oxidoreductase
MTALPQMMTACRVTAFGPPSAIGFEQIPVPTPGAGEVLVRVHAAGVGPWDGWIRSGASALPQPLPLTLGSDLAGTVERLGPGVDGFDRGDPVFGVTNSRFTGAYAEYAIASAAMIAKKPADLDFVDAASVPVVAVTAWQALFEEAKLAKGQSVLIHGGAGNVGAYAIQLAHQAGLKVAATVGQDDIGLARSLGANQAIDYRASPFETVVEPVDAVLDLVGGETQLRSFKIVKRGGALISAVSQPDLDLAAQAGISARFFLVEVTRPRLEDLARLIGQGKLATSVGAVLPLASARIAHEMLEGKRQHPRGKIVLTVAS